MSTPFARPLVLLALVAGALTIAAPEATASTVNCGVAGNLIQNCGFETGDFSSWDVTQAPPGDTRVEVSTSQPHLGSQVARFGGTAAGDKISQTLAGTVPGTTYLVRFWVNNDSPLGNNHVTAAVDTGSGTVTLLDRTDAPVQDWTLVTGSFVAGATAPTLTFAAYNVSAWWRFDDVAVTPATTDCANVPGNLLGNCGWESNFFPPWVAAMGGADGDLGVAQLGADAHSGDNAAYLTSNSTTDDLWAQAVHGTTPGRTYLVQLWVKNESSGAPDDHLRVDVGSADLGGSVGTTTLLEQTDVDAYGWTLYTGSFVASALTPTLGIYGNNTSGRFWLDDVSVTAATPTIVLPSTLPNATYGTSYAQSVAASGGTTPYAYAVTSGSLPASLTLDSGTGAITGSPTAAGPSAFTVTATDGNGYKGSQAYTLTVDKAVPSLGIDAPTTGGVVGQTAAITSSGTPGGTVTNSSATPATCSVSGTTVTYLHPGTCTIDVTREADANYLARTVDTTVAVAQATTTLEVAVHPHTITANVAVNAPGAGTPTGTVNFQVDGNDVGTAPVTGSTATLSYTVPAGMTHEVSATYSGDADFADSSDSTSRHDPTITAALTSATPKNASGWYRSPVTVTFTCTPNGAPLTDPCPAPVVLSSDGAGRTVSRTIDAEDGGIATVAVTGINIDRTAPRVRVTGIRNGAVYGGVVPKGGCVATDALSGVLSCTLTRTTQGTVTRFRATATDRAGNTAVVTGSYRIPRVYLYGVRYAGGAWQVTTGNSYRLVVTGTSKRPRYVDAAPYPHRPHGLDNWFTRIGPKKWAITVTMSHMGHDRTWNLGVLVGHKLRVVRVHTR